MVPSRRSVMGFFVLLLLVLAGIARAAPEVAVVNLLPRHLPPQPAQAQLSHTFAAQISLNEPPSRLIEALRWATPDPARDQCLEEAGVPHDLEDLFTTLLERAGGQVRAGAFGEALTLLTRARALLPCQDVVVPTARIQQLFMLEARSHLGLQDGHEVAAFEALLAVDPRLELEPDEPDRLAVIFGMARSRVMLSALAPLDAREVRTAAWLDGQPLQGLEAVRAGTHLVQMRGPTGELRTRLVAFRAGEGRRLADLDGFRLPAADEVMWSLARAVAAGGLDRAQARALDRYLASERRRRIAFVIAPADAGQAGSAGNAAPPVRPPVRPPVGPPARPPARPPVTPLSRPLITPLITPLVRPLIRPPIVPPVMRLARPLVVRVYTAKGALIEARTVTDLPSAVPQAPKPAFTPPLFPPRQPLDLTTLVLPGRVLAAPPSLSSRIQRNNRLHRGGFCLALLSSGFGAAVFFSLNEVARGQHALNSFRPTSEPGWLLRDWVAAVMQNTSRLGTPHYGREGLLGAGLYFGARLVGSSRSELSIFGGLAQNRSELWSGGQKDVGRWQTGFQGRF